MGVSFDSLEIGKEYDRTYLAKLWGYADYTAIARGIVTPKATNFIILFITHEKQVTHPQYEDFLKGNMLNIEGETNHISDKKIINASVNDSEIHLFYRSKHHSPFTYYGQIKLIRYQLNSESPSRFTFQLQITKI